MAFITDDTIVAVATAAGRAALAVVRLSGSNAVMVADQVFRSSSQKTLSQLTTHHVLHGHIYDNDQIIDEVVATVMRAPHSYTGEDTVEFSAHGGPVTLGRILELVGRAGGRLAAPGEFTFRAFTNGKMDLAQAEAVADVIASLTESSAQAALEQLVGKLSERVQSLRGRCLSLVSRCEAALDFSEDDIQDLSHEELSKDLHSLEDEIIRLLKTADKGKYLRDGLTAVIIGKPNAGKSSLFNALLERERAIVTDIPGTTRDTLEELLDVRGIPVRLIDTAGLAASSANPAESIGQERTKERLSNADVILLLIDGTQPLSDEDRSIAELVLARHKEHSTIALINKSDLPVKINIQGCREAYPYLDGFLRISAFTREGLGALEEAIFSHASAAATPEGAMVINVRHQGALSRAAAAVSQAQSDLHAKATEEIIAAELRDALDALGEITGETTTEEILDTIFSKFCVGK